MIERLPGTSERFFDSGALRFYVGQTCFAYQSADLASIVVVVDPQEWEVLQLAPDPDRRPMAPASSRQRVRYAALSLADVDQSDVEEAIYDAWSACAPRTLRRALEDGGGEDA